MKCSGRYKHLRHEYDCPDKWGCRNFSFRITRKRETPVSRSKDCEFRIDIVETT